MTKGKLIQLPFFRTIADIGKKDILKAGGGSVRKNKYNLVLDELRYDLILVSMIEMKNMLISEGRYTDAVDEAMIQFINAKRKYI